MNGEDSPVLELADVQMVYPDGTEALASTSVRLSVGEFVAIVGPSGCGKSTLLRIASMLDCPTGGTTSNHARGNTGFVFQDATLLPWRTMRSNVELLGELSGLPRRERRHRAAEAIDRVGLSGFERHKPAALSGGMRMRASLARALVLSPLLLLLDEPFGALDELTRERLGEQLSELYRASQWAALLVTHSVTEAVFLANRVLVMSPRPGRIVAEITVPFDYPRLPELRFSSEFSAVAAQVSQALRGGHASPDEAAQQRPEVPAR